MLGFESPEDVAPSMVLTSLQQRLRHHSLAIELAELARRNVDALLHTLTVVRKQLLHDDIDGARRLLVDALPSPPVGVVLLADELADLAGPSAGLRDDPQHVDVRVLVVGPRPRARQDPAEASELLDRERAARGRPVAVADPRDERERADIPIGEPAHHAQVSPAAPTMPPSQVATGPLFGLGPDGHLEILNPAAAAEPSKYAREAEGGNGAASAEPRVEGSS